MPIKKKKKKYSLKLTQKCLHIVFFFLFFLFIYFLFVVNFVIHWNERAMGLQVFPILIPPPTSLSTRSLSTRSP